MSDIIGSPVEIFYHVYVLANLSEFNSVSYYSNLYIHNAYIFIKLHFNCSEEFFLSELCSISNEFFQFTSFCVVKLNIFSKKKKPIYADITVI